MMVVASPIWSLLGELRLSKAFRAVVFAYTTVATVLTRLHAKGLVEREPVGRAFVYRAIVDESEFAVRRIDDVLSATSDRSSVLAHFVRRLSAREARQIRDLLDQPDQ